jgi:type I restriction enzyme S subunit
VSEACTANSGAGLRGFKPYPAYKDSGHEWLGEIPAHWGLKRLKRIAEFQGGGTPSKDNLDYWGGDIPWVSPKDMKVSVVVDTEDKITPQGVRQSATRFVPAGAVLLVVRSGILVHSIPVALAGREVTLNQDLKALIPRSELLPEYLLYMISGLQKELLVEWRKEGATVESLEIDLVAQTQTPLPSEREQRAIAAFLDRETTRIDALVAKKERLVELLHEKRTALINRAVTKGLDPNVRMKDSGIEWLGEIPAHWHCLALARVSLSRCDGPFGSGLKSEHYSGEGVRVVRLQNIGWAEFLDTDHAYIDEAYARKLGDHSIIAEDLLIAGLGDERHPVGRACTAPAGIEPAMVKADCFRFRLDHRRLLSRFAAYQLSVTASATAGSWSTGATRSRMNLTTTAARKVAVPTLDEQSAIVESLDRDGAEFRALASKVREAIDGLRELRTALISAAVTGKIDVREEAA